MLRRLSRLPDKLCGKLPAGPPCHPLKYACWSFISGTVAILVICLLAQVSRQPLLIGSFGASCLLLFGVTDSPLAQPRNLIGGHLVGALVAVAVVQLLGSGILACAIGVGLAILLMNLTGTEHPPAGATALIGVQGGAGLLFVLMPVLSGAVVLLLVALFTNNVVHHRRYPDRWW